MHLAYLRQLLEGHLLRTTLGQDYPRRLNQPKGSLS
jgi:hypothetical protein